MVNPFYKKILLCGLLFPVLMVVIVFSASIPALAEASTAYLVSTRDHFDKFGNVLVSDRHFEPFDFADLGCPQEAVIYVHGVWTARDEDDEMKKEMFENAIEASDRVRLSLKSLGYTFPVIGFSWDSDTDLSENGWRNAEIIAKENGPKLAQFTVDLKERCPQTTIIIIAHSLGARVVLSSLDSLHNNQVWNSNNFQIASVHLMGAAVDDDEVSKDASDVTIPGGIKSAYGKTIEDEVLKFYNLVNQEDDALEPGLVNILPWLPAYGSWNTVEIQPVYYPYYEQDLALGQSGIQSSISEENTPRNYLDIFMDEREIPFSLDNADTDSTCDLRYPTTFGFVCTIALDGDNHLGYIGFRGPTPNSLRNNGAMDIVLETISP
jgi:Alpha/beta hydrolase of unknown function (DUF900)